MITAIQAYIDAHDAGPRGVMPARDWLDHLPPAQVFERFDDFAPRCPDHLVQLTVKRPANALNVEIGTPQARCRAKTPSEWGNADPRAVRWLASGGSPLVLDLCDVRRCPRGHHPSDGSTR